MLHKTVVPVKLNTYQDDYHLFYVFEVDDTYIMVIDMESPTNDWFVFETIQEAEEYMANRVWAGELIRKMG